MAGKPAGGDGVPDSDAIVLSANEVGRVVRFFVCCLHSVDVMQTAKGAYLEEISSSKH